MIPMTLRGRLYSIPRAEYFENRIGADRERQNETHRMSTENPRVH